MPYTPPQPVAVRHSDIQRKLDNAAWKYPELKAIALANNPSLKLLYAMHVKTLADNVWYKKLNFSPSYNFISGSLGMYVGPDTFSNIIGPILAELSGDAGADAKLMLTQHGNLQYDICQQLRSALDELESAQIQHEAMERSLYQASADYAATRFMQQKGLLEEPEKELHFSRTRIEEAGQKSRDAEDRMNRARQKVLELCGVEP
jgi:hypothetical protein